ncbi:MAG: sulfur reduction protein DsrE [Demequina sp.]|uniref:sulfur reduction protein DsrE n=1 Tax=Demequina sp. TaxID=2050685 RepID=UPI001994B002|nr:sulfur reduction protein DsrE [Demequina sp.]MBC7299178.1 sulfur reduction protein DsrE [Demequina sp.]
MTTSTEPRIRVAVVIYEDAAKDLARAYRGLLTAAEFLDAGDDVTVVYDGSGVDTLAAASHADHRLHALVEQLRPITKGACAFCVKAHGVSDAVAAGSWPLLEEYKHHASLRNLMVAGYQILSF